MRLHNHNFFKFKFSYMKKKYLVLFVAFFVIDSFNKLLAREDSSISLCVIQHIEDFEYKIYIKSYFD